MTFPQTITASQANKETPIGEMFADLKWAALLSHDPTTTSGLTFGVNGGSMLVDGVLTTVADQTTLLAASSTNYVEATRAGTVSNNATGFTAGRMALYVVATGASGITSIVDWRTWADHPGIAGRVSVAVTGADVTLSAAQARCEIINVTGALTGNRNLIVPDGPQQWCVTNNTTGAYTLTVKTAAGAGVSVTQGKAADLLADGTNVVLSNNDSAAIGGALQIANNLSDVANAATSRTNLGLGTAAVLASDTDVALGANSDTRLATQKAIKAYVDAAVAGLSWKQAVRAATTAAGTLAASFANGSIIDGVTLATGDRILIKNQAAGAENGIYIVPASGAPARSSDADSGAELVNASVYVSEGTTLADTQWTCSTNAPITVGTTSIAFAQLSSGSGSVAADAIWDAAGDLAVGTGANTAAKLTMGTALQVLRVNAGATGLEYATPASGGSGTKTYEVLTAMTSQPPASNFATLDARNSVAVLEYDAAVEEATFWVWVVPEGASLGSGLIVKLHWMGDTATSGDVKWGVAFERMNTDVDTDSYDTETTGTGTTNATSGIITVTSITCTTIDGVTAGDAVRIKIARKAADGADTMSGDAQLVAVEIRSAA
jgi:hypothetical protein